MGPCAIEDSHPIAGDRRAVGAAIVGDARRRGPATMNKRWMAEIFYNDGRTTVLHAFEELYELHELVEMGPNWNTIDRIVITLNLPSVEPAKTRYV
jgi:hypothetical protein